MSSIERSENLPIYESLVRERGDVLAETRKVAEQTRAHARRALDWSAVRDSQRDRENRAFSAFG
ncbi:hypothetical protein [Streptomyces sp. NPDC002952]|uniref:hypothetical protein n=1 Tax=Streptomyces sp. NPDC002952 TaxID=3364673 RepID=UPI0036848DE3